MMIEDMGVEEFTQLKECGQTSAEGKNWYNRHAYLKIEGEQFNRGNFIQGIGYSGFEKPNGQ